MGRDRSKFLCVLLLLMSVVFPLLGVCDVAGNAYQDYMNDQNQGKRSYTE